MLPYIYIGSIRVATYGSFLSLALLAGFFLLRRDLRIRKIPGNPSLFMAMIALAGLVGAKLWHCLENPALLFAHPMIVFQPGGLAFFGGLVAGAVMLVYLAHVHRIPVLRMMDIASPPTAIGYAIARLGCLTSGDGDYGIPTRLPWGMTFPNGLVPTNEYVHPTPIYESIVALAIFYYLWRLRRRALDGAIPDGQVFAVYLILSGIARFLVEFIRINPRVLFGMSNAQVASLVSVLFGFFLYLAERRVGNSIAR